MARRNLIRSYGAIVTAVTKTVFAKTQQHVYHHLMQVMSFIYSQELMMKRLVRSIATTMVDAGSTLGTLSCIERKSSVLYFPLVITLTGIARIVAQDQGARRITVLQQFIKT